MAQIFQRCQDGFTYSYDAPASEANWLVIDTEDPTEVAALIAATIPTQDDFGNPLINCRTKHLGAGIWEVFPNYGAIPPLATGLTIWEYDTTGGREKMYQSLGTRYQQKPTDTTTAPAGGSPNGFTNFNGAIAPSESGPKGVDRAVPKMQLTAKRKYWISGVTNVLPASYVEDLEAITATTNAATFDINSWGQELSFNPGELLFLGAIITVATSEQLEIDHKFEASRDRLSTNDPANPVTVAGFSAPVNKPGWDYASFIYSRGVTSNSTDGFQWQTPVPIQYQSEQIYLTGDFTVFIL